MCDTCTYICVCINVHRYIVYFHIASIDCQFYLAQFPVARTAKHPRLMKETASLLLMLMMVEVVLRQRFGLMER